MEENDKLSSPFTEDEIKFALFSMEKNKAAGPDKIPIEFYQACWDIIKGDIMELFEDFHNGKLDVYRLNYGVITFYQMCRMLPKFNNIDQSASSTTYISGLLKY